MSRFKIGIIIGIVLLGAALAASVFAITSTGTMEVTVTVTNCNNDGVCASGETHAICPADCPCNNDGVCGSGETHANCPADCPCNNDGVCDAGENSTNCSADCGGGVIVTCPPFCPCVPPECPEPTSTPLFISGIAAGNVATTSAEINWQTNKLAYCQLAWGVNTDYGGGATSEIAYALIHSSLLYGLTGNTLYHFYIRCTGSDGSGATTGDHQFRTLGEADTTPPGNVINLSTVAGDSQVTLFWQNPADADFAGVIIRRSTSYYPGRSQGVLIYDGNGVSFLDSGLTNNTVYYYSVFSYDTSGNHASGVGVIGQPYKGEKPTTTPPVLPPIEPPGGFGGRTLTFRDFTFDQLGQALPVDSADQVSASTEYGLNVGLQDFKALPGTARLVFNLVIDGKITSYIFDYDAAKKLFSANLPSIPTAGRYSANIVVLDTSDRAIKNVSGWIIIGQPKVTVLPSLPEEININIYAPLSKLAQTTAGKSAAAATLAIGLVAVVLGTPWWNFWFLLQLFFTQPLRLLWSRRGWGTVYNSITKKPVDLALVRLYKTKENKLLASRVTDKNGRYIFLVDPGEYYLQVEKAGYEFPSVLLKRARDDGNYVDLYYGEPISVSGNDRAAIIANIPFDQKDVKLSDQEILHQFSRARWTKRLSWLGPGFAAVYLILYPSWLSGLLVVLHLLILWLFARLGESRHKKHWGVIYDKNRKNPIKKAITRVFSSEYGRMLEFYVTDNQGRYGFLVGDNKYYVTADKDGYKTAQTPLIDLTGQKLEKMVIAQDLLLAKADQPEAPVTPPISTSSPVSAPLPEMPPSSLAAPVVPAPPSSVNSPAPQQQPEVNVQPPLITPVTEAIIAPVSPDTGEIKKDMIKSEKEINHLQPSEEIKTVAAEQKTPIELLVESRMQNLREKQAVEPAVQPEAEVKPAEPQLGAEAKPHDGKENIFG